MLSRMPVEGSPNPTVEAGTTWDSPFGDLGLGVGFRAQGLGWAVEVLAS